MAEGSISIFEDSVLKLSINQGTEPQREVFGDFTSGELAYTRDTGRIFVGDYSDSAHAGIQTTMGGSLSGNKYIAFIDSRPLASETDNSTPLNYTVDDRNEAAILGDKSKFRITHGADGKKLIDPYTENDDYRNWDRTATYNYKLNAYTGDYFFDIYQNALVLVDHRIQEGYKPNTSVVNGVEVFVDNDGNQIEDQVGVQRRTPIKNYSKPNGDITNENKIYGEGYVIMRILEPDNQTIRFKPKGFDKAGVPSDPNNYNHNLLEVFYVPFNAMRDHFSTDFTLLDKIYLNKEIEAVESITTNNKGLKLPGNIIFSTKTKNAERGSEGYMSLNFNPVQSNISPDTSYKLKVSLANKNVIDEKTGSTYPAFDVDIVPEEKAVEQPIQDYYFKLEGGLQSNQANPNMLRLDKDSTTPENAPVLTVNFEGVDDGSGTVGNQLADGEKDPFGLGQSSYTVYSSNFGLDDNGVVQYIDVYEDAFYQTAKAQIEKFEEQNTSINYLRKPVTVMSTSHNPELYSALGGGVYTTDKNGLALNGIGTPSKQTKSMEYKVDEMVKTFTGPNQCKYGYNGSSDSLTTKPAFVAGETNYTRNITIPEWSKSGGMWVAVSTPAIPNNREVEKIIVSATIEDLTESSNVERFTGFVALKQGTDIEPIKLEVFEQYYSNFSFTFTFNVSEVLLKGSTYIIFGISNTNFATQYTLKIDKITYSYRAVNAEQAFQLKKTGINAYLDFVSEPYFYCSRKIVTSPDTGILPKMTAYQQWLGNNFGGSCKTQMSSYVDSINGNATYSKTWNNMVTVLGHNHVLNVKQEDSSVPVETKPSFTPSLTGTHIISDKMVFKQLRDYEVNPTTNKRIDHTLTGASDASKAIFSWWEEYQKNGNTHANSRYYVDRGSEVRNSAQIYTDGENIDFIYINKAAKDGLSTDNKIGVGTSAGGNSTGVVVGPEVNLGNGWYAQQRAIFAESSLLNPASSGTANNQPTFITYGRKSTTRINSTKDANGNIVRSTVTQTGWDHTFDLYKHGGLSFNYKVTGYLQTADGTFSTDKITKAIFYKANFQSAWSPNVTNFKDQLTKGLTIDTVITGSTVKPSDYAYLVLVYDDPSTAAVEQYTNVYQIIKYPYIGGIFEPKSNLGSGKIAESSSNQNINEEIAVADRVYIPKHARSIILEMTHITSVNNTVAMFYANEFKDLGAILSGYDTEEFAADPNTFTNELTVNPWYNYPNNPYAGYTSGGKLQLPQTKASYTATSRFHNYNQTADITATPSTKPSIYSAAPNEKCLCNSSNTETRLIEVPFHRSNITGVRHCSLRLANLRPATKESANYFCLKLVGYRV